MGKARSIQGRMVRRACHVATGGVGEGWWWGLTESG